MHLTMCITTMPTDKTTTPTFFYLIPNMVYVSFPDRSEQIQFVWLCFMIAIVFDNK